MSINLKVIGAGMGRTGTTSLKLALELLLGGDCFHFLEYKTHPKLMLPWQTFVEKLPLDTEPEAMPEISVSQCQLLMPDYLACVDEPASFYWMPLSKAFPEALIILSVRDTESWWNSMHGLYLHREQEQRQSELISPERLKFLEFEEAIYGTDEELFTEAANKALFEQHNRRILNYAEQHPSFKQRFLVWNVKQGWEPLCEALGLPMPDIPFPHANKAADFHGY